MTVDLGNLSQGNASAVSFSLASGDGTQARFSASVSGEGVLVIDMPDSVQGIDSSQAVLMGMMVLKKEQKIGISTLKGVLLRRGMAPLGAGAVRP